VYVWVDGVHFNVRLEDERLCTLVMIGRGPTVRRSLITVEDGYRESAESWKMVLRDLKRRGMREPLLAIGDGALGFWAAVRDVWPKTFRATTDALASWTNHAAFAFGLPPFPWRSRVRKGRPPWLWTVP
jgi:transposase-like protein